MIYFTTKAWKVSQFDQLLFIVASLTSYYEILYKANYLPKMQNGFEIFSLNIKKGIC